MDGTSGLSVQRLGNDEAHGHRRTGEGQDLLLLLHQFGKGRIILGDHPLTEHDLPVTPGTLDHVQLLLPLLCCQ